MKKKIKMRKQHGSVVSYDNESTTITTGEEVDENYQDQFGTLLDQFLTYCVQHNPTAAYNLLSTQCKNLMYQTEESFESSYYRGKFEGDKSYKFQSWSTSDENYIYLVQIFDNPLSSGSSSNSKYIEDYITIAPEDDIFKVNVNGYINREEVYKNASNDLITAKVTLVDNYMENKIYTINLKNNTEDRIVLDTREDPQSTYLIDTNGNKSYALLYENNEADLTLEPQEAKTIKIKFNATYRNGLKINKMEFTNIVRDQDRSSSYTLSIDL